MKKIVLIVVLLWGFNETLQAQYDCSRFYPFSEGVKSTLTLFDESETAVGTVEYKIDRVISSGGSYQAVMSHRLTASGIEMSSTEYNLICEDGNVRIDFMSLARHPMLERIGNVNFDSVTGNDITLPNDLAVGQTLPDGGVTVNVTVEGMPFTVTHNILDREVVGFETITTPAGEFECFVITSKTTVNMGMSITNSTKQWFSEGKGIVQSEDYDQYGNLMGKAVLTAFEE